MKKIANYSVVLFLVMFFLSSCQNNPASGKKEINLMSEKEEQNIGNQEHPKIIKEFGGIYKNEKLQNYQSKSEEHQYRI